MDSLVLGGILLILAWNIIPFLVLVLSVMGVMGLIWVIGKKDKK